MASSRLISVARGRGDSGLGNAAEHRGEKWLMAALGLILGGTVGNLYDRLVFNGVRDFLYFYYIEWPVFNFADCCLVVGAGLLLVQAIFASRQRSEAGIESR